MIIHAARRAKALCRYLRRMPDAMMRYAVAAMMLLHYAADTLRYACLRHTCAFYAAARYVYAMLMMLRHAALLAFSAMLIAYAVDVAAAVITRHCSIRQRRCRLRHAMLPLLRFAA